MDLQVRRLAAGAELPARVHSDDAGLDLCAVEPTVIAPGERAAVGTGIAVAVAPGHAGLVLPRSGLALRHGIALVNAPGLIDPGYRGEIRVLLLNTDRINAFEIKAGDRIAQLVVIALAPVEPLEVSELGDTARGAGGFGSTG